MVERTRIGRIKNLNFATIGSVNWNLIPTGGENSKICPNLRAAKLPSLRATAKQSGPQGKSWIASSQQLLATMSRARETQFHVVAARIARGLQERRAETKGAGKTGCALHPRSRVQSV
jgi:hypothetical protein